jgi:hypothetical protein
MQPVSAVCLKLHRSGFKPIFFGGPKSYKTRTLRRDANSFLIEQFSSGMYTYCRVIRWKSTDISEERCFLAWLILRPWWWRWHAPPKRRLTFSGLHGVMTQKTELFIITAVRTSDPTRRYISQGRTLHNHRCENLRSYTALYPRR